MMDDPVLLYGTAGGLVLMPLCSTLLSKWKLKLIFAIPALSLLVSLPMFLFVVIVPTILALFVLRLDDSLDRRVVHPVLQCCGVSSSA
jgi:hypothetical protein